MNRFLNRRLFVVLFALFLGLAVALPSSAFALDAPGSDDAPSITGKPATKEDISLVKATSDEWAARLSEQNITVLDMMEPESIVRLFSNVDPVTALPFKFKTRIIKVTHVVENEDGTLTAQVSYSGFNARYAYQAADIVFKNDGGEFLRIVGIEFVEPTLPEDQLGQIQLQLDANSVPTFMTDPVVDFSTFTAITVTNQSESTHLLVLIKSGEDANDPTTWDAFGVYGPNTEGPIAARKLPVGTYEIFDLAAASPIFIGTITINPVK